METFKSMNDEKIKQYLKNQNNLNFSREQLKSLTNAGNLPLLDINSPQNYVVQIIPDGTIERAKFLPIENSVNQYKAHPVTIRAMKKDLFLAGEDFIDLECIIECKSCREKIDLQFWLFCPFCESNF